MSFGWKAWGDCGGLGRRVKEQGGGTLLKGSWDLVSKVISRL